MWTPVEASLNQYFRDSYKKSKTIAKTAIEMLQI